MRNWNERISAQPPQAIHQHATILVPRRNVSYVRPSLTTWFPNAIVRSELPPLRSRVTAESLYCTDRIFALSYSYTLPQTERRVPLYSAKT